jgi:hypothetical protein
VSVVASVVDSVSVDVESALVVESVESEAVVDVGSVAVTGSVLDPPARTRANAVDEARPAARSAMSAAT